MCKSIADAACTMGALTGWRRNLAALLFGVMAVLALPPFFIMPMVVPAFCGLYWLVVKADSPRRAFFDGWWWGWGYHIAGLYWFCIALLTDPEKFAWLIPFALFGLTGVIAIYAGIACLLFAKVPVKGISRAFVFSVIWVLVEYARGHLFTGFPWNLMGYSFAAFDSTLQLASLIGAYGLTWFAVWLAVCPALLVDATAKAKQVVLVSYMLFAAATLWGTVRLASADTVYVEGVQLRLVQANISQHHKWDLQHQMEGVQRHIRLTLSPGIEAITHVIWPETAVPYAVQENTPLTRMLGQAIPPSAILITGALRSETTEKNWNVWNSIMGFDHTGTLVGSYDKQRLVPFGEFLPFRTLFPESWLTPVGMKDLARGTGPQNVNWPGLPVARPLICYEAIFPELIADKYERAAMLLNITNDAWFGMSIGPYQHFHMARMRAVEQGMPLVRVANTGISGVTDAYGRVQGQIGLGKEGVLDIKLQKPQPHGTTYHVYKDLFLLLLILLGITLISLQRKMQKS